MFALGKEKQAKLAASPVDALLARLEAAAQDYYDDYLHRVQSYLTYAKDCGLHSQSVADSCVDLAETYTDLPALAESRRVKTAVWMRARKVALAEERPPIDIDMELDPIYFEAILHGAKTYEGRAWKPDSNKNYPGIRAGDRIRFRLSDRDERFTDDAARRGLAQNKDMICTVRDIYFAPTVHGLYQIVPFNGLGFQPMIGGPAEMLQLQRGAVYHTFPGYHDLIGRHGFLGIEVENPQLILAA